MKVIGLDGCARGWIGVVLEGDVVSAYYFTSMIEVLELVPDAQVVAVDIPIGLLDSGARKADSLARGMLSGPRQHHLQRASASVSEGRRKVS